MDKIQVLSVTFEEDEPSVALALLIDKDSKFDGYKFFFVPTGNPMNLKIDAYSLDSLKVFESFKIPHKVALHQCATEEGFIRTIIPFAIKIGENLSELEDSKWKSILESERAAAIAECGARNEKEAKLLDDFKKRK